VTILVPAGHAREISMHGESAYPEEGAGLLLGAIEEAGLRRVLRTLPLPNRWEDEARTRRYRIDPLDLLDAEERAEEDGLTILGIYHSHPDHPARPSGFDLERALPFYTYVITEIRRGSTIESRGGHRTAGVSGRDLAVVPDWRQEDEHRSIPPLAHAWGEGSEAKGGQSWV
jgi:proteasome lid subunit RPN8/RPN11